MGRNSHIWHTHSFCMITNYIKAVIRKVSGMEDVQNELNWCRTLRRIHVRDSIDIEELYRTFVFPNLPRRPGREGLLSDLIGTSISEAIYILESLHAGLQVEGDICEFGVAQGATSKLLASEIMDTDRELYLFDSFEGLPPLLQKTF